MTGYGKQYRPITEIDTDSIDLNSPAVMETKSGGLINSEVIRFFIDRAAFNFKKKKKNINVMAR